MHFRSSFAPALLMLAVVASKEGQPGVEPSDSSAPGLKKFSPIEFQQLCSLNTNYCIYVDQVRPGTVHASPVNATDDQGGFLFEIAAYRNQPFHVCFGGCCIDIHFSYDDGCVRLEYVNRPSAVKGHLLARFANNVENIVGPKDWMFREQVTCENESGGGLPYAVIGARSGSKSHSNHQDAQVDTNDADKSDEDQGRQSEANESASQGLTESKLAVGEEMPHDYFDDPTVAIPNR